ncbi:MAG TPA: hypothetical protein VFW69_04760 [Mycobacterium sp.]|nr:hypothetical protein [Mycobacterium sp.]
MIRIRHVCAFRGEDVVLLAADGAGIDTFLAALSEAQWQGALRLPAPDRVHEFVIEAGAAHIELEDRSRPH